MFECPLWWHHPYESVPVLELVRRKAAVCAEAVSVLDEAALPCAWRSCDKARCVSANLMSPSSLGGQCSTGMLQEAKVGIDARGQRFPVQPFDLGDPGNGTCPQVRVPKSLFEAQVGVVVSHIRL